MCTGVSRVGLTVKLAHVLEDLEAVQCKVSVPVDNVDSSTQRGRFQIVYSVRCGIAFWSRIHTVESSFIVPCSFGVLLLEVISGRPAVSEEPGNTHIKNWVSTAPLA